MLSDQKKQDYSSSDTSSKETKCARKFDGKHGTQKQAFLNLVKGQGKKRWEYS
jgi:hypothetical protein